ncbi:MAG: formate dehydrogenase accessory sulfurtransferase FdhD [Saprospiraceae bacterium]|nr:formate dehydrogenase accessory sulfurtransferase FdhD [Saprospiraceae bacterium]
MNHTRISPILRINTEGGKIVDDKLTVEEPLEIVVGFGTAQKRQRQTIAVTMRTPDHDFDLALGFLFTEGVIARKKDVANIRFLSENKVLVDLNEHISLDINRLNRHFYTTSSCGVCGKSSLEAVATTSCFFLNPQKPLIRQDFFFDLPTKLRLAQSVFDETGGTHASALFDTEGVLLTVFEDVGRHNALDKLVGWALQQELLPLDNHILLVSGRTSFELIQKAVMAGIPIVAAVGAPSSLAVELAEENNVTLVGFLRKNGFNVYSGSQRIDFK